MQQHHKQRLIGAVVVVALAVIFLPMLLQGPVDRGTTDMAMDIPPRPQVEQGPADADQPEPDSEPAPAPDEPGEAVSELEAVPLPQSDRAEVEDDEPGDAPPPEPVPEEDTPEETADATPDDATPEDATPEDATPEDAGAEDAGAEDAGAETAGEDDELASWAVQVGSFTSESNALGLRDRLRDQGFSAYVDRLERDGQDPTYRLRVGPVVERDAAEALLEDLQEDADLDGLVVSHP
ncbi:SPOR domain-containing protein [Aquisalimonas sp. APHAB1-3]|uniref:SPOR domain-containing protein n=1 Tax=Aquisalimonas sp. APHAB1-3 TaxID=3402080 RepID=UPI003AAA30DA